MKEMFHLEFKKFIFPNVYLDSTKSRCSVQYFNNRQLFHLVLYSFVPNGKFLLKVLSKNIMNLLVNNGKT